MKATITKERARNALCYIVGYLTDNATMRKSDDRKTICGEMPIEDATDVVAVLAVLINRELARNVGSNRNPIYISTAAMNTGKLNSDEAVTGWVDKIFSEVGLRLPDARKVVLKWGREGNDDEEYKDELKQIEQEFRELNDVEPDKSVLEIMKSAPKERKTVPEKPKSVPKIMTEEVPTIRKHEEFLTKIAEHNPEILVSALRSAGWEVTARKTIVTEL